MADSIAERIDYADKLHTPTRREEAVKRPGWWARLRSEQRQRAALLRQEGRRLDEILLFEALTITTSLLWHAYVWPRGFVLAHRLGWVSRAEGRRRLEVHCASCRARVLRDGREYCRAERGGRGCGCPESAAWPVGTLAYKRRLRAWACPRGLFGPQQPATTRN